MNSTRLVVAACLAVVLVHVPSVGAQTVPPEVSMAEAVSLFGAGSPDLRLARLDLLGVLEGVGAAGAVPNPAAQLTHEDVGPYHEQYVNVVQPVNFLWERGPRGRRAEAMAARARATFREDSARLVREVRRAYVHAWSAASVLEAFREADALADVVLEGVTATGFELRRLEATRATIGRRLARAELAVEDAERTLGALISADLSMPRVRASDPPAAAALPDRASSVAQALSTRPELERARWANEVLEAEATLARRSIWSGTALTGGFKRQSDGRNGVFLGLQVPVPVFDRATSASAAARAARDRAAHAAELEGAVIAREVRMAEARLEAALRMAALSDTDAGGPAQLLELAREARADGTLGAADLLDATTDYLEARERDGEVRAELWLARVDLGHSLGAPSL